MTFCVSIHASYFVSCSVSDIWRIIRLIFAVDRGGAPLFNALIGGWTS